MSGVHLFRPAGEEPILLFFGQNMEYGGAVKVMAASKELQ